MEVGGRASYLFSLDIRQIRVFCTVDKYLEHGTLELQGKNLQSHVKDGGHCVGEENFPFQPS